MPIDPCHVIGEVLGRPAQQLRERGSASFECPFIGMQCIKRSQKVAGPFPVCSVYRAAREGTVPGPGELVAVCPKRFMDTDFLHKVADICWEGEPPEDPTFVHEVKMAEYGSVDFVIAQLDGERNTVLDFVSVELQAIDVSGSYASAYTALMKSEHLPSRPTFGFNWANVRKRYITQLIQKGIFHHHWGTKIASVLQDHVYEYLHSYLRFHAIPIAEADIVFVTYRFEKTDDDVMQYRLVFDKAIGTTHGSLMMQALYRETPPKETFCRRIIERAHG